MYKVFIDGGEGTTGLKIFERFERRADVEIVRIDPAARKDVESRLRRMAEADVTFLCLPDAASSEIVAAADAAGVHCRVIDTSTAFRTAPGWVYGLPELCPEQPDAIRAANRVAAPGCHATGFVLIARPLIALGVAPPDYPFACRSLTGFSGGGKKMIADYAERSHPAPRLYGLSQGHKHLPEMTAFSGADALSFEPVVSNYYGGMLVSLPLHTRLLKGRPDRAALCALYADYYARCPLIEVVPPGREPADGFLDADAFAGRSDLEIRVCGDDARVTVIARLDNLGKGASGGAVQCMNLMLGLPETAGL